MTITELIKKLEAAREAIGDVQVHAQAGCIEELITDHGDDEVKAHVYID